MLNFSLIQLKRLSAWLNTPLGQSFLNSEVKEIEEAVNPLFGYHLLMLGEPAFIKGISQSLIRHQIWGHLDAFARQDCSALKTRQDKLPILADSIDVVYLAHCLEFINNPHEVLREVYRVLIGEGHVIISGFNPWSAWGLYRYLVRFIRRVPWDGHFISVLRLKDWLALLGFEVLQVKPYFFRMPIAHEGFIKHSGWLEGIGRWCWPFFSGGYVLVAKKQVALLTAIRPIWKTREKTVRVRVAEPAARVE